MKSGLLGKDMSEHVNRIAYINLNGELETIAPDGENRHILTHGDRFFQFPAWSPDGRHIAAVGGTRDSAGVFVFEDSENSQVHLTGPHAIYESESNAPIYLFWSPDNEHLSFITIRAHEESMGLHVVAASAGPQDTMAQDVAVSPVAIGRPCFWDWSSDGKRILLHTGLAAEESAQLSFIDPFNPKSGRASIARPGLFQAPGIARSGRYWAFAQVNRQGELQLVVDGRTSSNRLVVAHNGIAALSWSPAHDQLAYISPTEPVRTYYGPLRVLNAPDGKVRTLTDDIVLAFFWSPDGRYIAYFTIAGVAEQIWANTFPDPVAAALDGGFFDRNEIRRMNARRQPADAGEKPVADGRQVSYELEGEASEEDEGIENDEIDMEAEGDFAVEEEHILRLNLWCVDVEKDEHRLIKTFEPVDLFVNQFLPFFDQFALSHRIWSPDSKSIVLPMIDYDENDNDVPRVFAVPMTPRSGKPRAIADGVIAFWSQQ